MMTSNGNIGSSLDFSPPHKNEHQFIDKKPLWKVPEPERKAEAPLKSEKLRNIIIRVRGAIKFFTALAFDKVGTVCAKRISSGASSSSGKGNPRWTSRFPSIMDTAWEAHSRFISHWGTLRSGVTGRSFRTEPIGNHIEMEKGVQLIATSAQIKEAQVGCL